MRPRAFIFNLQGAIIDEIGTYYLSLWHQTLSRHQGALELQMLRGSEEFLRDAVNAEVKIAVVSDMNEEATRLVLERFEVSKYFDVVITSEDLCRSKPDPEVYFLAAERLGVEPEECILFDSCLKGVEAAYYAGMQTVVLTTMHHHEEFADFPNVILYLEDFTAILPQTFIGTRERVTDDVPVLIEIRR
jgi:beta-phosphoglucomutase